MSNTISIAKGYIVSFNGRNYKVEDFYEDDRLIVRDLITKSISIVRVDDIGVVSSSPVKDKMEGVLTKVAVAAAVGTFWYGCYKIGENVGRAIAKQINK